MTDSSYEDISENSDNSYEDITEWCDLWNNWLIINFY